MGTPERLKKINKSDFYLKANLHTHSNCSDGTESFNALIEQAKMLNLEHFSICDHNTMAGYVDEEYKKHSFFITGVEFDCFFDLTLLHIIGYGVDPKNEQLQALCTKSKAQTEKDIIRLFHSRHPKAVIEAIHSAGGVAILAHPCCCWVFSLEKFIKRLVNFGLDGVEVYYPYDRHRGIIKFHKRKKALEITEKLGLIKTGGTDCHTKLLEK